MDAREILDLTGEAHFRVAAEAYVRYVKMRLDDPAQPFTKREIAGIAWFESNRIAAAEAIALVAEGARP